MRAPTESRFLDRLTREIEDLLRDVLAFEASYSEELENVDPDFRDSARNLLHYLGVRRHEIRRLPRRPRAHGCAPVEEDADPSQALYFADGVISGSAPVPETH